MKKRMLFLTVLLCVLLLWGCASSVAPNLADSRESYPFDQYSCQWGHIQTDHASYYIDLSTYSPRILVKPNDANKFVPLCGKPNCDHKTKDCNAACSLNCLGYYKDRLYTVADEGMRQVLVSLLPDGTNRRSEMDLNEMLEKRGMSLTGAGCFFHNDKLALMLPRDEDIPFDEQLVHILLIDLGTKEVTEPFADYFDNTIDLGFCNRAFQNYIYTDLLYYDKTGSLEDWYVEMNMDTGEVRKLYPGVVSPMFNVDETTLYYVEPGEGFREVDLATCEMKKVGPTDLKLTWSTMDDDYLYGIRDYGGSKDGYEKATLYIFSKDYQLLEQIELTDHMRPYYIDRDYFYFGYSQTYEMTHYLDKSKIGSGNLELIPMA